ncbi:hypothetical protein BJA5080_07883 [Bradyrhizobium diazoefficiens SEMIA 5080]|uniref:Uncharacterized protein n=1 Tax=Bradyrhizobium diazoefficiens SEMIA 5080 TaxID=754504 RepID=A0A837CPH5_9BRAD|nr:hypothetical protein BJA5080_07883 [Bradyrhizobium diazoefficiens SEMIA 5080]
MWRGPFSRMFDPHVLHGHTHALRHRQVVHAFSPAVECRRGDLHLQYPKAPAFAAETTFDHQCEVIHVKNVAADL